MKLYSISADESFHSNGAFNIYPIFVLSHEVDVFDVKSFVNRNPESIVSGSCTINALSAFICHVVFAIPHRLDIICANDAMLKFTFAIFWLVTDSSIPSPVVDV